MNEEGGQNRPVVLLVGLPLLCRERLSPNDLNSVRSVPEANLFGPEAKTGSYKSVRIRRVSLVQLREGRMRPTKLVPLLATLMLFLFSGFLLKTVSAGDLEPTGTPGPTMKTLDQIEPRSPIPASEAPVAAFVISTPGSYYLEGDRHASDHGISVTADDVTIDLMGYSLIGPDSGESYGIWLNPAGARKSVEMKNGTITDFTHGIYLRGSTGTRIVDLRITSCGSATFGGGTGCLIRGCTIVDNSLGIQPYDSTGMLIVENVIAGNSQTGISARYLDPPTWLEIRDNLISQNGPGDNDDDNGGVHIGSKCIVQGNILRGNLPINIRIWPNGMGNVVQNNVIRDGAYGIKFDGNGNYYSGNIAIDNTNNYAGTEDEIDGGGNVSIP